MTLRHLIQCPPTPHKTQGDTQLALASLENTYSSSLHLTGIICHLAGICIHFLLHALSEHQAKRPMT